MKSCIFKQQSLHSLFGTNCMELSLLVMFYNVAFTPLLFFLVYWIWCSYILPSIAQPKINMSRGLIHHCHSFCCCCFFFPLFWCWSVRMLTIHVPLTVKHVLHLQPMFSHFVKLLSEFTFHLSLTQQLLDLTQTELCAASSRCVYSWHIIITHSNSVSPSSWAWQCCDSKKGRATSEDELKADPMWSQCQGEYHQHSTHLSPVWDS